MASVSLRKVRKNYGKTAAIHGIDMEIEDGAFAVIVGPSGCGKSTLLRMVAGLETVTGGEIAIGARVVNNLEPKDRDIAMVFQNYALYPHMSVGQNMGYSLKLAGVPRAEIAARVQQAAALLQLAGLLDRRPRQLSGGQRQRVAMGRAIVRDPAVFLFDEPLSNLDAKLRVQMRLEIKRLQQRLATTALYVTHDQVEAMTLGDRLIVMNEGVAEQIAGPLEVYERPATLFVAGFIGSPAMNVLKARVLGNGLLLEDAIPLAVAHPAQQTAAAAQTLLGIRPEHLILDPENPDFTLAVEMVETLGADSLAYGRIAGAGPDRQGPALTIRLPGRLPGSQALRSGDRLPVRLEAERLHLFDPHSGRRLPL